VIIVVGGNYYYFTVYSVDLWARSGETVKKDYPPDFIPPPNMPPKYIPPKTELSLKEAIKQDIAIAVITTGRLQGARLRYIFESWAKGYEDIVVVFVL
jgi:hypothetical protein